MTPLGPIALSAFMLFGQGSDFVTSQQVLQRCPTCYESNTMMSKPAVMISAKGALVVGSSVAVYKLWPKHKKTAIALSVIVGGYGIHAALRNKKVNRTMCRICGIILNRWRSNTICFLCQRWAIQCGLRVVYE
jgi:hypothetical protein